MTRLFTALLALGLGLLVFAQVRNSSNRDNTYGAWVYFEPNCTIPASSVVRYVGPIWGWWSTEDNAQVPVLENGQVAALYIRTSEVQQPDASMTFTVRLNAADLACAVTVPAGGAIGWYATTGCIDKVTAGDLWNIKAVNGSATSTDLFKVAVLFR